MRVIFKLRLKDWGLIEPWTFSPRWYSWMSRSHTGSKGGNPEQTGPNQDKPGQTVQTGTNRDKPGQTMPNWGWGHTGPNRAKQGQLGANRAKQSQMWPNEAKRDQTLSDGANQSQMGPNRAKRSQTESNKIKQGQTKSTGPIRTKPSQTWPDGAKIGLNGAKWGQMGPRKEKPF